MGIIQSTGGSVLPADGVQRQKSSKRRPTSGTLPSSMRGNGQSPPQTSRSGLARTSASWKACASG